MSTQQIPYVTITAFYALSLPEYHMPLHTHDSLEIMYVTGGKCTIFTDQHAFSLSSNEAVFLPSRAVHRLEITAGQPCTILNLEFSLSSVPSDLSLDELFRHHPDISALLQTKESSMVIEDSRALGYALKDLISQLQREEKDAYLQQLLFYRTLIELTFCADHTRSSNGMYYLKKACTYIEENLLEPLTVPDIAAHAGINKSYLQLLFSRTLHCSVGSYVTGKRMEQAAFLLSNSSLAVTDVAFASGYNSRQHFAHTFEKHFHMNPSAYRKLHSRAPETDTKENRYYLGTGGSIQKEKMTDY